MNIDKGDNIILKVARLVMILVMLLSFFISGCVELPTEEQTWYVDIRGDADFSDIQTAIEAAADGDIVLVAEGLYQSSVNIS